MLLNVIAMAITLVVGWKIKGYRKVHNSSGAMVKKISKNANQQPGKPGGPSSDSVSESDMLGL